MPKPCPSGENRRSEGALRPLPVRTLDGTPLRAPHRTHVRVVINLKGDGSRTFVQVGVESANTSTSGSASGGLVYGTLPRALLTWPPSFPISCHVSSTPATAFARCRSWAWMCARTRASPSLSCGAEFPFPFPSPYLCRVGTALPLTAPRYPFPRSVRPASFPKVTVVARGIRYLGPLPSFPLQTPLRVLLLSTPLLSVLLLLGPPCP